MLFSSNESRPLGMGSVLAVAVGDVVVAVVVESIEIFELSSHHISYWLFFQISYR